MKVVGISKKKKIKTPPQKKEFKKKREFKKESFKKKSLKEIP
ncbi:hypothetical protein [Helicobacter pylori]|nr:hypothetical protein [Helicobacter pylori]